MTKHPHINISLFVFFLFVIGTITGAVLLRDQLLEIVEMRQIQDIVVEPRDGEFCAIDGHDKTGNEGKKFGMYSAETIKNSIYELGLPPFPNTQTLSLYPTNNEEIVFLTDAIGHAVAFQSYEIFLQSNEERSLLIRNDSDRHFQFFIGELDRSLSFDITCNYIFESNPDIGISYATGTIDVATLSYGDVELNLTDEVGGRECQTGHLGPVYDAKFVVEGVSSDFEHVYADIVTYFDQDKKEPTSLLSVHISLFENNIEVIKEIPDDIVVSSYRNNMNDASTYGELTFSEEYTTAVNTYWMERFDLQY